jgi:hypothetical protein
VGAAVKDTEIFDFLIDKVTDDMKPPVRMCAS